MIAGWHILAELVSVLAFALFLGIVARRLGQKPIVAYLLAGVVVGPKGLALVQGEETVNFLAELGVALLLFTVGLELSWHRIGTMGRKVLYAGLLQFSLTWGAGGAVGWLFGLPPGACFVVGNILALSSTAFIVRIMQDRSELDSRHGRLALGILLLQDLLLVPLLVVQTVLAERRSGFDAVVALSFELAKGAALIGMMYLILRLVVLRAFRGASSYADREVPVILSVLICMGCAWASHTAGLSPVLGAFLAGVLLADQPVADQIRANVTPLSAVFVTLFFASIGMLAGVPRRDQILLILLIAGVIVMTKALLAGAAIRWSGHPVRVAVLGGFALAQIGEFSFVLAEDGRRRGLLNAEWFEMIVSASVLTLLVSPYLFPLGDEVAARLVLRRRGKELRDAIARTEAKPPDVVLIGYGPAGREVLDQLLERELRVTVIESNPALAATIHAAKRLVGDATSREILQHARIAEARVTVISIPDPATCRTILALVRTMAPEMPVLARGRYHRYVDAIRALGANEVADEEIIVGGVLGQAALKALAPSTPDSSAA